MGDRAVIYVKGASCSAYLHWSGGEALEMLKEAIPKMRKGDPDYSMARLIGHLCSAIDGNTGVGTVPPIKGETPTDEESHGDAGVIVYDSADGTAKCYCGYLAKKHKKAIDIGIPPE